MLGKSSKHIPQIVVEWYNLHLVESVNNHQQSKQKLRDRLTSHHFFPSSNLQKTTNNFPLRVRFFPIHRSHSLKKQGGFGSSKMGAAKWKERKNIAEDNKNHLKCWLPVQVHFQSLGAASKKKESSSYYHTHTEITQLTNKNNPSNRWGPVINPATCSVYVSPRRRKKKLSTTRDWCHRTSRILPR